MKIEIRERNVRVPSKLRAHVERRLELLLGRFDARIARVFVHFSDTEVGLAGQHKQCAIEVLVKPSRSVRAEDSNADPFVAADRASAQLGRLLARSLERERQFEAWR